MPDGFADYRSAEIARELVEVPIELSVFGADICCGSMDKVLDMIDSRFAVLQHLDGGPFGINDLVGE